MWSQAQIIQNSRISRKAHGPCPRVHTAQHTHRRDDTACMRCHAGPSEHGSLHSSPRTAPTREIEGAPWIPESLASCVPTHAAMRNALPVSNGVPLPKMPGRV